MPAVTMLIGVILILIGVGGYGYGYAEQFKTGHAASPTALIPAVLGLIITILGFMAATRENLRKHLMHAALGVALVGLLATISSVPQAFSLMSGGTINNTAAVISKTLTALSCLILIILGLKSFIDARRNRV